MLHACEPLLGRGVVLEGMWRLTVRGEIVSFFLGPEGLALAAALEDRRYPLDDLLFDSANLFAGDRFSGTNPRRLGRCRLSPVDRARGEAAGGRRPHIEFQRWVFSGQNVPYRVESRKESGLQI